MEKSAIHTELPRIKFFSHENHLTVAVAYRRMDGILGCRGAPRKLYGPVINSPEEWLIHQISFTTSACHARTGNTGSRDLVLYVCG